MGFGGALSLSIGCWAFGEMVRRRPRDVRVMSCQSCKASQLLHLRKSETRRARQRISAALGFMDLRKADQAKFVLTGLPIGQIGNAVPQ